jgi:metal-responsive CopG/Arc/MetJ family transcriptional regulator
MSNLTRTQIYLPQDLLEEFKVKAQIEGITNLSQYMRELLQQSLNTKPKTKKKKIIKSISLNNKGKKVHYSTDHNKIYDYDLQHKN